MAQKEGDHTAPEGKIMRIDGEEAMDCGGK